MSNARWVIWSDDRFDRESPRTQEACGAGLEAGLMEYWRTVLRHGINDAGQQTLASYSLEVLDGAGGRLVLVPVASAGNPELAKLRQIVTPELMLAVVRAHARLLSARGGKSEAADAEARRLLEATAEQPGAASLRAALQWLR